ncbi:MAG: MFS transporter [Nitrososphaerota archaeon]|nr:MFS transporter [Nitrososphaerota archaeon]MDG7023478.1 MFS transporter [Nitrososphaerota archaeon]
MAGAVEESSWTSVHTWTFIAFSFGMLLEAYIYGLSSVATGWYPVLNSFLKSSLLAWAPIWLSVGIIFAGPMADRIGRKTMFYVTMSLYAIGGVGILLSGTYYFVLTFLAMLLFAAGGEMNTIMAATHELMPRRHRSKAMFWEVNFINVGGVLLAVVALSAAYGQIAFQREMIGFTFIPILLVLAYSRWRMPESIRWLERKGKTDHAAQVYAKYYSSNAAPAAVAVDRPAVRAAASGSSVGAGPSRRPSVPLKMFVTTAVATANAVGFGLMTYVLGPYYFPNLTADIILVANVVGFVVGAVVATLADRLSRVGLLLYSSVGVAVVTYGIYLLVPEWSASITLFWILLVALNLFVGVNYLSEDTLKGELWPTEHRGLFTAIPRVLSIGIIDTIAIYATSGYSLSQYTLFNALIWTLGLVGAVAWALRGIETGKGVSVGVTSGEEMPRVQMPMRSQSPDQAPV